jgi:hypothetical protein
LGSKADIGCRAETRSASHRLRHASVWLASGGLRWHPVCMAKLCCPTMSTLSRTREDLLADLDLSAASSEFSDWEPLVEWVPHIGLFSVKNVAIFYCPWCGSQLEDKSEEAMSEGLKTGVLISVDPSGNIHAEVAGEPVDATELLAGWKGAANDQD